MFVLQIEHPVMDYAAWKKAFESDPLGRQKSGVLRYRVMRPADNPRYVIVDLEFATVSEAEAMRTALRKLWGQVEGSLIEKAQARILEIAEHTEY